MDIYVKILLAKEVRKDDSTNKKWFWFSFILALVVCSNFLIYRLESLGPIPTGMALGSLFDFIITIPLLVYFFIIRKRYSLKYLLPVMLLGYGGAVIVIPHHLLSAYSFVKYILLAGEVAFSCSNFTSSFNCWQKYLRSSKVTASLKANFPLSPIE